MSSSQLGLASFGQNSVPTVACSTMQPCPVWTGLAASCVNNVCDPNPIVVESQVGNVIDVSTSIAMLPQQYAQINTVEILELKYNIVTNTLTFSTAPIEIWWAPAGAVAADPAMGAYLLGTVPPIAAMTTGMGQVTLDAAGNAALSNHLSTVDKQFKLFAKTSVDLASGDAIPSGGLTIQVVGTFRVTGQIL